MPRRAPQPQPQLLSGVLLLTGALSDPPLGEAHHAVPLSRHIAGGARTDRLADCNYGPLTSRHGLMLLRGSSGTFEGANLCVYDPVMGSSGAKKCRFLPGPPRGRPGLVAVSHERLLVLFMSGYY